MYSKPRVYRTRQYRIIARIGWIEKSRFSVMLFQ
jgi:hypothetical protein